MAKNDAEKAEAERRNSMTQEQRDAEDAALLQQMENEERARNAVPAAGLGTPDRAALTDRVRTAAEAAREKLATIEATVAAGHLFTHANQTVPFKRGDKVMLTPQEHATLSASGHIVGIDGTIAEPSGPAVYREAGLIVGHAPGQGTAPDSAGKK